MQRSAFSLTAAVTALALASLTACSTATSTSRTEPSTAPRTTTTLNALEQAARAGLSMTGVQYRARANEALAAASAARAFASVTPGVEVLWIATDGTPTLGVSDRAALTRARAAHWAAQLVPTREITDSRYAQVQQWASVQDHRTRSAIVLTWPDYTTGEINVARNTTIDPTGSPHYPPHLHIRDVPGTIAAASNPAPIAPSDSDSPTPGDAFHTGLTPSTTCTIGVPTPTGFITVAHCTGPTAVATAISGKPLGSSSAGPTDYTRTVTAIGIPAAVRVDTTVLEPVTSLTLPVIGAPICKAGARSGWQCGTIVGTQGNDSFISTACSLSGDSGGPALIGQAAVGVTDISTIGAQNWCPSGRSGVLAYTVHRNVV